jgi:hypothetical protein
MNEALEQLATAQSEKLAAGGTSNDAATHALIRWSIRSTHDAVRDLLLTYAISGLIAQPKANYRRDLHPSDGPRLPPPTASESFGHRNDRSPPSGESSLDALRPAGPTSSRPHRPRPPVQQRPVANRMRGT